MIKFPAFAESNELEQDGNETGAGRKD